MASMAVVLALVVVTVIAVTVSRPTTPSSRFTADYRPLPPGVLAGGDIMFTRLAASRLSAVRVTPADAVRIATSEFGGGHGSRVVLVSLGGYVDKSQIVRDWVGTRSFIPTPVPSYVVRIREPFVVTVEPSKNHFWNVIVSATSGHVISAFSYD